MSKLYQLWFCFKYHYIYDLYAIPRRWIRRIKNIIRWIPVIYDDGDRDYDDLIHVMEYKLTRLWKTMEEHNNKDQAIKSIKIAALCLRRIKEDDYFAGILDNEDALFPKITGDILNCERMENQDVEELIKQMKKIKSWWC